MAIRFPVLPPVVLAGILAAAVADGAGGPRQVERLGRGVVAVPRGDGSVLVSWRVLGTDPEGVAFEVDRVSGDEGTARVLVEARAFGCRSINGSKANPSLCADLLGDWREEVIWPTEDGRALRVFTTTIPTEHRLATLMHDPTYRLGIAWQNVSYNQPAHPGFFLGEGMEETPRPAIRAAGERE